MITLAERIRGAAKGLKEFTRRDISDAIGVMSYQERDKVFASCQHFISRGEFKPIGENRYRYMNRKESQTYRQRFWNIARRMVRFTFNDLEQITEANKNTIQEFCVWIVKKGYAERVRRGHFKVIGKLKPAVPSYNKRKELSEARDQRKLPGKAL